MNTELIHTTMTLGENRKDANAARASLAERLKKFASSWWPRVQRMRGKPTRRLHLRESLALGERRFVAVVEFEERRFLVGGTSGSIVLLATLDNARSDRNPGTQEGSRY